MSNRAHGEERLAELLSQLPPAPVGWVKAAQELPEARSRIDELVERARTDAAFRAQLFADLEGALDSAGYGRDGALVDAARARLTELDRG